MVQLTRKTSNSLFDVLEDWNTYLSQEENSLNMMLTQ